MTDICENEGVLQYLYFMGFAPLSFLAWALIGTVYLIDRKLSIPPGQLIAAEAFSYMISLITSLAFWPVLKRYHSRSFFAANTLNSCVITGVIASYTTTLAFTYDLAVSIELTYKVVKPSKKGYFIPLKAYHITCNLISVLLAAIEATQGQASYAEQDGCDFTEATVNM
jgi:hypothetical protein